MYSKFATSMLWVGAVVRQSLTGQVLTILSLLAAGISVAVRKCAQATSKIGVLHSVSGFVGHKPMQPPQAEHSFLIAGGVPGGLFTAQEELGC